MSKGKFKHRNRRNVNVKKFSINKKILLQGICMGNMTTLARTVKKFLTKLKV